MVQHCCIPGCKNRAVKDSPFSFHQFPSAKIETELYKKWLTNIGQINEDGSQWLPKISDKVCSEHFKVSDFGSRYNNRCLLHTSVPTVFPTMECKTPKKPDLLSTVVARGGNPTMSINGSTQKQASSKQTVSMNSDAIITKALAVELQMECIDDDLSPAQLKALELAKVEHEKANDLIKLVQAGKMLLPSSPPNKFTVVPPKKLEPSAPLLSQPLKVFECFNTDVLNTEQMESDQRDVPPPRPIQFLNKQHQKQGASKSQVDDSSLDVIFISESPPPPSRETILSTSRRKLTPTSQCQQQTCSQSGNIEALLLMSMAALGSPQHRQLISTGEQCDIKGICNDLSMNSFGNCCVNPCRNGTSCSYKSDKQQWTRTDMHNWHFLRSSRINRVSSRAVSWKRNVHIVKVAELFNKDKACQAYSVSQVHFDVVKSAYSHKHKLKKCRHREMFKETETSSNLSNYSKSSQAFDQPYNHCTDLGNELSSTSLETDCSLLKTGENVQHNNCNSGIEQNYCTVCDKENFISHARNCCAMKQCCDAKYCERFQSDFNDLQAACYCADSQNTTALAQKLHGLNEKTGIVSSLDVCKEQMELMSNLEWNLVKMSNNGPEDSLEEAFIDSEKRENMDFGTSDLDCISHKSDLDCESYRSCCCAINREHKNHFQSAFAAFAKKDTRAERAFTKETNENVESRKCTDLSEVEAERVINKINKFSQSHQTELTFNTTIIPADKFNINQAKQNCRPSTFERDNGKTIEMKIKLDKNFVGTVKSCVESEHPNQPETVVPLLNGENSHTCSHCLLDDLSESCNVTSSTKTNEILHDKLQKLKKHPWYQNMSWEDIVCTVIMCCKYGFTMMSKKLQIPKTQLLKWSRTLKRINLMCRDKKSTTSSHVSEKGFTEKLNTCNTKTSGIQMKCKNVNWNNMHMKLKNISKSLDDKTSLLNTFFPNLYLQACALLSELENNGSGEAIETEQEQLTCSMSGDADKLHMADESQDISDESLEICQVNKLHVSPCQIFMPDGSFCDMSENSSERVIVVDSEQSKFWADLPTVEFCGINSQQCCSNDLNVANVEDYVQDIHSLENMSNFGVVLPVERPIVEVLDREKDCSRIFDWSSQIGSCGNESLTEKQAMLKSYETNLDAYERTNCLPTTIIVTNHDNISKNQLEKYLSNLPNLQVETDKTNKDACNMRICDQDNTEIAFEESSATYKSLITPGVNMDPCVRDDCCTQKSPQLLSEIIMLDHNYIGDVPTCSNYQVTGSLSKVNTTIAGKCVVNLKPSSYLQDTQLEFEGNKMTACELESEIVENLPMNGFKLLKNRSRKGKRKQQDELINISPTENNFTGLVVVSNSLKSAGSNEQLLKDAHISPHRELIPQEMVIFDGLYHVHGSNMSKGMVLNNSVCLEKISDKVEVSKNQDKWRVPTQQLLKDARRVFVKKGNNNNWKSCSKSDQMERRFSHDFLMVAKSIVEEYPVYSQDARFVSEEIKRATLLAATQYENPVRSKDGKNLKYSQGFREAMVLLSFKIGSARVSDAFNVHKRTIAGWICQVKNLLNRPQFVVINNEKDFRGSFSSEESNLNTTHNVKGNILQQVPQCQSGSKSSIMKNNVDCSTQQLNRKTNNCRRIHFSTNLKIKLVHMCRCVGIYKVAKEYNIDSRSLRSWCALFKNRRLSSYELECDELLELVEHGSHKMKNLTNLEVLSTLDGCANTKMTRIWNDNDYSRHTLGMPNQTENVNSSTNTLVPERESLTKYNSKESKSNTDDCASFSERKDRGSNLVQVNENTAVYVPNSDIQGKQKQSLHVTMPNNLAVIIDSEDCDAHDSSEFVQKVDAADSNLSFNQVDKRNIFVNRASSDLPNVKYVSTKESHYLNDDFEQITENGYGSDRNDDIVEICSWDKEDLKANINYSSPNLPNSLASDSFHLGDEGVKISVPNVENCNNKIFTCIDRLKTANHSAKQKACIMGDSDVVKPVMNEINYVAAVEQSQNIHLSENGEKIANYEVSDLDGEHLSQLSKPIIVKEEPLDEIFDKIEKGIITQEFIPKNNPFTRHKEQICNNGIENIKKQMYKHDIENPNQVDDNKNFCDVGEFGMGTEKKQFWGVSFSSSKNYNSSEKNIALGCSVQNFGSGNLSADVHSGMQNKAASQNLTLGQEVILLDSTQYSAFTLRKEESQQHGQQKFINYMPLSADTNHIVNASVNQTISGQVSSSFIPLQCSVINSQPNISGDINQNCQVSQSSAMKAVNGNNTSSVCGLGQNVMLDSKCVVVSSDILSGKHFDKTRVVSQPIDQVFTIHGMGSISKKGLPVALSDSGTCSLLRPTFNSMKKVVQGTSPSRGKNIESNQNIGIPVDVNEIDKQRTLLKSLQEHKAKLHVGGIASSGTHYPTVNSSAKYINNLVQTKQMDSNRITTLIESVTSRVNKSPGDYIVNLTASNIVSSKQSPSSTFIKIDESQPFCGNNTLTPSRRDQLQEKINNSRLIGTEDNSSKSEIVVCTDSSNSAELITNTTENRIDQSENVNLSEKLKSLLKADIFSSYECDKNDHKDREADDLMELLTGSPKKKKEFSSLKTSSMLSNQKLGYEMCSIEQLKNNQNTASNIKCLYTDSLKRKLGKLCTIYSIISVSKKYGLNTTTLSKWKAKYKDEEIADLELSPKEKKVLEKICALKKKFNTVGTDYQIYVDNPELDYDEVEEDKKCSPKIVVHATKKYQEAGFCLEDDVSCVTNAKKENEGKQQLMLPTVENMQNSPNVGIPVGLIKPLQHQTYRKVDVEMNSHGMPLYITSVESMPENLKQQMRQKIKCQQNSMSSVCNSKMETSKQFSRMIAESDDPFVRPRTLGLALTHSIESIGVKDKSFHVQDNIDVQHSESFKWKVVQEARKTGFEKTANVHSISITDIMKWHDLFLHKKQVKDSEPNSALSVPFNQNPLVDTADKSLVDCAEADAVPCSKIKVLNAGLLFEQYHGKEGAIMKPRFNTSHEILVSERLLPVTNKQNIQTSPNAAKYLSGKSPTLGQKVGHNVIYDVQYRADVQRDLGIMPKLVKPSNISSTPNNDIEIASTWKQVQSLKLVKSSERKYSQEFKNRMIKECEQKGQKVVSKEHRIPYNELSRWRLEVRKALLMSPSKIDKQKSVPTPSTKLPSAETSQAQVTIDQETIKKKAIPAQATSSVLQDDEKLGSKKPEPLKIKINLSKLTDNRYNKKNSAPDKMKTCDANNEKTIDKSTLKSTLFIKTEITCSYPNNTKKSNVELPVKKSIRTEEAALDEQEQMKKTVINYCFDQGVFKTQKKFNFTRQSILDLMKEYEVLSKNTLDDEYHYHEIIKRLKTKLVSREKTSIENAVVGTRQPLLIKNLNDYIVTEEYKHNVVHYARQHGITATSRKFKRKLSTVRRWITEFQREEKKKITIEQELRQRELMIRQNMSFDEAKKIAQLQAVRKRKMMETEFRKHIVEYAKKFGITAATKKFKRKAQMVKIWMGHFAKSERDAKKLIDLKLSAATDYKIGLNETLGLFHNNSQSQIWNQDFVIKSTSNENPLKLTLSPTKSSLVITTGLNSDDIIDNDPTIDEVNKNETKDEDHYQFDEVYAWEECSNRNSDDVSNNLIDGVQNIHEIKLNKKSNVKAVDCKSDDAVVSEKRNNVLTCNFDQSEPIEEIDTHLKTDSFISATDVPNIFDIAHQGDLENLRIVSDAITATISDIAHADFTGQLNLNDNENAVESQSKSISDNEIVTSQIPIIVELNQSGNGQTQEADAVMVELNLSGTWQRQEADADLAEFNQSANDQTQEADANFECMEINENVPYEETIMFKLLTEEVDNFFNRKLPGPCQEGKTQNDIELHSHTKLTVRKSKRTADFEIMENIEETCLFNAPRSSRNVLRDTNSVSGVNELTKIDNTDHICKMDLSENKDARNEADIIDELIFGKRSNSEIRNQLEVISDCNAQVEKISEDIEVSSEYEAKPERSLFDFFNMDENTKDEIPQNGLTGECKIATNEQIPLQSTTGTSLSIFGSIFKNFRLPSSFIMKTKNNETAKKTNTNDAVSTVDEIRSETNLDKVNNRIAESARERNLFDLISIETKNKPKIVSKISPLVTKNVFEQSNPLRKTIAIDDKMPQTGIKKSVFQFPKLPINFGNIAKLAIAKMKKDEKSTKVESIDEKYPENEIGSLSKNAVMVSGSLPDNENGKYFVKTNSSQSSVVMETFEELGKRLATEQAAQIQHRKNLVKESVNESFNKHEIRLEENYIDCVKVIGKESSVLNEGVIDYEIYKDFMQEKITLILDIARKHGIEFASISYDLPISVIVNWIIEKDRKHRRFNFSENLELKLLAIREMSLLKKDIRDVANKYEVDPASVEEWKLKVGWLVENKNVLDVLDKWQKLESMSNLGLDMCALKPCTENISSEANVENSLICSKKEMEDKWHKVEPVSQVLLKMSGIKSCTENILKEADVDNSSTCSQKKIEGSFIPPESTENILSDPDSKSAGPGQIAEGVVPSVTELDVPDILSFTRTLNPRDYTIEQRAMIVILIDKYGMHEVYKKLGLNSGTLWTWKNQNKAIKQYLDKQTRVCHKPKTDGNGKMSESSTVKMGDCVEPNFIKKRQLFDKSKSIIDIASVSTKTSDNNNEKNNFNLYQEGYRIISPTKLPPVLRDCQKMPTKEYSFDQRVAIVKLVELYGVRTIHKQFRIPQGSIWNWQHDKNIMSEINKKRLLNDETQNVRPAQAHDEADCQQITIDTILDRVFIAVESKGNLKFTTNLKSDVVCLTKYFGLDYVCEKLPQIPKGTIWNWQHNKIIMPLVDRKMTSLKKHFKCQDMNSHNNIVCDAVNKTDLTEKWLTDCEASGRKRKAWQRDESTDHTKKRKIKSSFDEQISGDLSDDDIESSSGIKSNTSPGRMTNNSRMQSEGRQRHYSSPSTISSEISGNSEDFEEIISDDEKMTELSLASNKSERNVHMSQSAKSANKCNKGSSSGISAGVVSHSLGLENKVVAMQPLYEVLKFDIERNNRITVCYKILENLNADILKQKHVDVSNKRSATDTVGTVPPPKKKLMRKDGELVFTDTEGNWLPLDDYYYGIQDGNAKYTELKGEYRFKCWYCSKMLYNNVRAMQHIQGHIDATKQQNIDLSDLTQCKHCYKQFDTPFEMQTHVEKVHLSNKVLMCRICEKDFETVRELMHHMKTSHHANEMPYVCQLCNFRSSMYSDVVDHFKKRHDSSQHLLCLYCLRAFDVKFCSQGWGQTQTFYGHLLKHMSKSSTKKCLNCRLTFFNTLDMKNHKHLCHGWNQKDAQKSLSNIKQDLVQKCVQKRTSLKSLNAPSVSKILDYGDVIFPSKAAISKCVECKMSMSTPDHYKKFIHCSLCRFATSCSVAYANHMMGFHSGQMSSLNLNIPWERPMKELLYCNCGFPSKYGNKIANHLVFCTKTACSNYKPEQSESVIKSLADNRDDGRKEGTLLGMLGLVQKKSVVTRIHSIQDKKEQKNVPAAQFSGTVTTDNRQSEAGGKPIENIGLKAGTTEGSHFKTRHFDDVIILDDEDDQEGEDCVIVETGDNNLTVKLHGNTDNLEKTEVLKEVRDIQTGIESKIVTQMKEN